MRGILNGIGWLCCLGCACITLAANFRYGLQVSAGEERFVFAAGGAFLDGLKTILPIALGTLLIEKIRVGSSFRLLLGTAVWLSLVAWSMFCAMQLYELSRATKVGDTEAAKLLYRQHTDETAKAETRLAELTNIRPAEQVEGEIGAAKVDKLYARSKQCGDATAAESREFCAKFARLTAEKLTAMSSAEIKAALALERQKLAYAEAGMANTNLAEVLSKTDPGTRGLADFFGVDVDVMRYRLAVVFAALLELGGGLCGWLISGGHLPRWRPKGEPIEPDPLEKRVVLASAAAPENEPPPLTAVEKWIKECTVVRKGTFTPSKELHEHFSAWAAVNGHKPTNKTAFGIEMTRIFGERIRNKKGGEAVYLDIALVPRPLARGPRVAVDNTDTVGSRRRELEFGAGRGIVANR